jgi:uncharacterized RDD family membrane protein YckC
MERVGFGLRFGAMLIDVVIVIVLMSVFGLGGVATTGISAMGGGGPGYMTLLIVALIPLLYSSLEIFKAASPGKMILKLVISNEDGTAAPMDVLAKRWATKYSGSLLNLLAALTTVTLLQTLGSIAGLVIFIGCFLVLAEAKQAIHDKVARTAVYKKKA